MRTARLFVLVLIGTVYIYINPEIEKYSHLVPDGTIVLHNSDSVKILEGSGLPMIYIQTDKDTEIKYLFMDPQDNKLKKGEK